MTPKQRALAASSPTLVMLLGCLAWNAFDRRWVDRVVRWLDVRND